MSLRTKLIKLTNKNTTIDKTIDLIYATNPMSASLTDLLFLMRLTNPNRNNPLAYLQIEALTWLTKNKAKLQKRLKAENKAL